jgi:general secretion pathway protein D
MDWPILGFLCESFGLYQSRLTHRGTARRRELNRNPKIPKSENPSIHRSHWGEITMMWGRETRRWSGVGFVLLSMACNPASTAFKEGRRAEARKDYDTAVIDFGKALQQQPENPQYLLHEKLARSRSSAFHLKQGRRLLAENRPDEAAGEFQKAVSVDPTNDAAAQELAKLVAAQAAAKAEREKALKQALKEQEAVPPAGVQLKPFPKEPLSHVRLTNTSKVVFDTLARLADLNVAYAHDFQPKQLSLDLNNVKVEDALRIAALEANVFWKVVTPNTILIIPDTPTNRREYEEEVLRTFHLANPLAAADRTAIQTALKQVLGLQKVIDNPESNSIIIRDTPERVAAAGELIHSLDLAKGEVLVEVTVLEASVDRLRNLGLAPQTQNGAAALIFTPPGTSQLPSSGGSVSTPTGALPLNQLGKLSTKDFSIILPNVLAQALLTDSRSHVLQNPQVRVTDGQTAKLRIGSRIPFATGSFLPSFSTAVAGTSATGGVGLLASTQFQYQDIGVNLDITPHITVTGEIGLHAIIEILSHAGDTTLGGISQPIFGQRKIEHDIRLKEGEVSLLGGLIERDDTRSISGLPGLGEVPGLRYFFSTEQKTLTETEVLIMLTPRIVRLPEVRQAVSTPTPAGTEGFGPTPRGFAPPQGFPPRPPP